MVAFRSIEFSLELPRHRSAATCISSPAYPARPELADRLRLGQQGEMDMSELDQWDSFYVIVGSAAGTLIGLQFVVITLIAERPPLRAAEAGAAFATPTIVYFSTTLLLSALQRVPWPSVSLAAGLWGVIGLGGVAYAVIVARRMRIQTVYQPEFEDWLSTFSSSAPFGSLHSARAIRFHGFLIHAPYPVRRCRGDAATALHRHSQHLGQSRLSRVFQRNWTRTANRARRAPQCQRTFRNKAAPAG